MSDLAFFAAQFAFTSLSGPLACTVKFNWEKYTPETTGAGELLSLLRGDNEPEARPADIASPTDHSKSAPTTSMPKSAPVSMKQSFGKFHFDEDVASVLKQTFRQELEHSVLD